MCFVLLLQKTVKREKQDISKLSMAGLCKAVGDLPWTVQKIDFDL